MKLGSSSIELQIIQEAVRPTETNEIALGGYDGEAWFSGLKTKGTRNISVRLPLLLG